MGVNVNTEVKNNTLAPDMKISRFFIICYTSENNQWVPLTFILQNWCCLHSEVLKYNVSTWVSSNCSAHFRSWEIIIAKRRLKWWRHPVRSSGSLCTLGPLTASSLLTDISHSQGQAAPDSCLIRLQHCSRTHHWCRISLFPGHMPTTEGTAC